MDTFSMPLSTQTQVYDVSTVFRHSFGVCIGFLRFSGPFAGRRISGCDHLLLKVGVSSLLTFSVQAFARERNVVSDPSLKLLVLLFSPRFF